MGGKACGASGAFGGRNAGRGGGAVMAGPLGMGGAATASLQMWGGFEHHKGVGRCGKFWKVYKHIMPHRCEHLVPKTRWWSWLEVFVVLPANLPATDPVLVAVLILKENIEHEAKQSITLEHDGSQNGCQNGRNLSHNLSNLRFRLCLGRKWPSLALRRFSYFRSSTSVLAGWRK